ncbi:HNH endonuclease [Nocardia inohanensis]|uniref:HNH endonuclease n=1 Tax=Nocardia inohanensis TaxID=209246 RepID=UPI001471FACB
MRARDLQRRAAQWGVFAELVLVRKVFERDRWVCHICGDLIPEHLRVTRTLGGSIDPLSPVLDHVIPFSKGGPHIYENCRAAHSTCNAKKYNNEDYVPNIVAGSVVATSSSSDVAVDGQLETEPAERVVDGKKLGRPRVVNIGLCKVVGCGDPSQIAGMCRSHRYRDRHFGDPLKQVCGCGCRQLVEVDANSRGIKYIDGHGVQSNAITGEESLWSRLQPQAVSEYGVTTHGFTDDCLIWTGSVRPHGYG